LTNRSGSGAKYLRQRVMKRRGMAREKQRAPLMATALA